MLKASKTKRQTDLQIGAFAPDAPLVDLAAHCAPMMEEIIRQFWGLDSGLGFLSVSEELQYFWQSDDYYVSQLQIAPANERRTQPIIALLRLSQSLCAALLEQVLGSRPDNHQKDDNDTTQFFDWESDFDFKRMSPLEASILSEFSKEILLCLRKQLIAKLDAKVTVSGEETHLLWSVQPHSPEDAEESTTRKFPVGTIVLSLPPEALKVPKLQQDTDLRVPDDFFYHLALPFGFYIGSGKMALSDVHQLESDDIVVLEASRIDRLFLIDPGSGERFAFSTKPEELRRRAPLSIPAMQQEPLDMENPGRGQQAASRKSLWDNLMIDVSAEFEPVRVPLKQLKQMTAGVVVEMGDLLHNKVSLQVEGKTLARGELVIVGDHFAVRVVEVLEDDKANNDEATSQDSQEQSAALLTDHQQAPQPEEHHEAPEEEASEEDELDDFLNDDFDEDTSG